jgi:hypothetical protein
MESLQKYGGRFSQTQSTIDTLLTALVSSKVSNVVIASSLGISRKRVAAAKERRADFDKIVENENSKQQNVNTEMGENVNESSSEIMSSESSSENDLTSENSNNESDNSNNECDLLSEGEAIEVEKVKNINIFLDSLNYRRRKIRSNKLNLEVVRDFCHDICRLDTFTTGHKVHIKNYDGSFEYHQVHIRNQSLKEYYKLFEKSSIYAIWQRENKKIKNSFEIFPTIKYRSFTNAFCPCCLNQKQRDCANHVQVSLVNALKALGSLRKLRGVSEAIRNCDCVGHKNADYMCCQTSLQSFINAVSCPEVQYPSLSQLDGPSISIKEQENNNIIASIEKEKKKELMGVKMENRNTKREGPAKQKRSIQLVSWGGIFSCHRKECSYQECPDCGINKFFNQSNLCNAERNESFTVKVRKYENVPGRSRGMQMEIVEVPMNGVELMEHLIRCAVAALPHEFNIKWNTHARQMCMNTYEDGCLNIMTDFSAVLDHDVQDRLNTAIPCHTNQCVLLACHSPRLVDSENGISKRIQVNDVWHGWSGQGGTLEANSYYHSVFMRHIIRYYATLKIERINVFTDGCAEQYKSRRNAYFIAELAKELHTIVTHNFAPTASFKTMVDGQGDLTKSTYRSLERNEVEGTRCPTSYDLFKLFTSDYPLTPAEIPDEKKRLMSITNRMHRFLIDTADCTVEMRERAEIKKDVIITDYISERWDAPALRGIKSIFCLIGREEDGMAKLYSRSHTCFCQDCMKGQFESCLYEHIAGSLKSEIVRKLPFKEAPVRSAPAAGDILEKINYFKKLFPATDGEHVIVAIRKENGSDRGELFELAVMTKAVKQLKKDFQFDFIVNGVTSTVTVEKDTWCITVRFLQCFDRRSREYMIPVKTKEVKVPMLTVYSPENLTEEWRIKYALRIVQQENSQTLNYYIIEESSLDTVASALTEQLDCN